MTIVSIEPLAIGGADGPRVYLLVCRIGRHLDVEEMPDEIVDDESALAFACKRWRVAPGEVVWKPLEVIQTGTGEDA